MLHPNDLYALARWRQAELIASACIEAVGPARSSRLPDGLRRLFTTLHSARSFSWRRSTRPA